MKIGFVSREFPPFFGGGVGTYVYQASRAMARFGHEVHVFTVCTDDNKFIYDPPGVTVHRSPYDPRASKLSGAWTVAGEWFYAAALFYDAVIDFLDAHSLDVIELPEWEAPSWFLLMDDKFTVPTVIRCHTPTWLLQELNGGPPLLGQNIELAALEMADAVCAPCGPMARRTSSNIIRSDVVDVLPYPFFADEVTDFFTPPDGKLMLFVGRLEMRKGVVDLAKAANIALAHHPDARLVFIGGDTPTSPCGGSMKEYLLEILDENITNRVCFENNMPAASLYDYYRRSAFCVFPSLFENFPNVCLEAMAAGRTAIVGNDSGMMEMMGETGIPVSPGHHAELADAMVDLLDHPIKCATMGKRAYLRVRKCFSPELIGEKQTAYFQSVIDKTGGSVKLPDRLFRISENTWEKVLPELTHGLRVLRSGKPMGALSPETKRLIDFLPRDKCPLHIALYGAGRHTKKILPDMESLAARGIHIEMILDDDDAFWGTKIFNTIIKSPRDVVKPSIDCVVLSSDAMEQRLWDKAQALREQGIAVIRLYDPKRKRS